MYFSSRLIRPPPICTFWHSILFTPLNRQICEQTNETTNEQSNQQPNNEWMGGIFTTASLFDNTSFLLCKGVYTSIPGLQAKILLETKMSHLQVTTRTAQILRISGHCCSEILSTLHTVCWLCLLVIRSLHSEI